MKHNFLVRRRAGDCGELATHDRDGIFDKDKRVPLCKHCAKIARRFHTGVRKRNSLDVIVGADMEDIWKAFYKEQCVSEIQACRLLSGRHILLNAE